MLQSKGELKEAAIFEFAKAARYADMVAGLSLLSGAPLQLVENLLQNEHREAVLVPCKAAGLEWTTVRVILTSRSISGAMSDNDLDRARTDYQKLSQTSAGRVLRFWQIKQTASNDVVTPTTFSPRMSKETKSQILPH